MKLLKKITILLCFLSLIAFVSCSAEDKSGVKEKDNADGTEITGGGKSGNSGTGGTSETGEGTGTGGTSETGEGTGTGGSSETGGGSGTGGTSGTGGNSGTGGTSETGGSAGTGGGSETGGTETIENGNFPPPAGTYRDDNLWNGWHDPKDDAKVSTVGNTTEIKGMALGDAGKRFYFDISKWKKTIKDGKDIKSEAIVEKDYGYKDISIVYYYDSSTLEITFKSKYISGVDGCLFIFKGTKISE